MEKKNPGQIPKGEPCLLEKTVLLLADLLCGRRYAFRGTASLVLQGLEMNVDDIDIVCDKETALACNKILSRFLIERIAFRESPKFRSYFGKFSINDVPVEVMGEWEIRDTKGKWSEPFNASKRKKLTIAGKDVYVTTIEEELLMFAKMGRWTAYQKIKRQLPKTPPKNPQQTLF
ncbi:MAG: hypothetical protein Q8N98_01280 [bacterium]|nr:hypothetical protein [bacterium]